jgi:glycerophosphoryl diester phosphodiesterase
MRDHRIPDDTFPLVVAHRGASSTRHDAAVDRTTNGTGLVHELTAAQLATLNAGTAEAPEPVPTLAGVLDLVSGRAAVALEIKNLPGDPAYEPAGERIVEATVAELERTAFDGPVLILSFNPSSIAAAKALAPNVATGFLTTRPVPPGEALEHVVEAGHDVLLPGTWSLVPAGPEFVDRAHAAGVRVGTWTADDPAEVRMLFGWGVDAVASNDPETALRVLAALER